MTILADLECRELTPIMKLGLISILTLTIIMLSVALPNIYFAYILSGKPYIMPIVLRAGASELSKNLAADIALATARLDGVEKRLITIETQRVDVRLAVLESRLETIFELGRVVLAASLVYLAEMVRKLLAWTIRRSPSKPAPSVDA